MIVKIEPLEKQQSIACGHPQCDGRPAKWLLPQLAHTPSSACCSVHLARYCERVIALRTLPSTERQAVAVLLTPFASAERVRCGHPRCDGRAAKWTLIQTGHRPFGPFRSCSVHLPRYCEIVQTYHLDVPTRRHALFAARTRTTQGRPDAGRRIA